MQILADIGNSSIKLGLADKGRIKKTYLIRDIKSKPREYFISHLKEYYKTKKINSCNITLAYFCSVAPSVSSKFKSALRKTGIKKVYEAGRELNFNIINKYKKPKQVGADRLINAIAAHHIYPKSDILIIDFGTAITFDVTTKKNEYLGGIIMPGVRISLAGLSEAAELLPIIKIKKPQGLIGKDTTTSIQNGVVYSVAAACQGIISRFKKKYGSTLKVIATGGDADFFAEYVSGINKVDCQLTLYGLYINYKQANIR